MRRRLPALCIDACIVVGFVVLGRNTHSEGEAARGIVVVAAPFLIGLALGWLACRRTSRPAGLHTGLIVWAATTVIGLALRGLVFSRPTPLLFILVASTFLALMLLGWRAVWAVGSRFAARGRAASELTAP
jgi:hypothetical protein